MRPVEWQAAQAVLAVSAVVWAFLLVTGWLLWPIASVLAGLVGALAILDGARRQVWAWSALGVFAAANVSVGVIALATDGAWFVLPVALAWCAAQAALAWNAPPGSADAAGAHAAEAP